MKRVRDILEAKKHKLLTISPHATVFAALKTMAEFDIGALVVTEGRRLVGIFSERDYARRVILAGKSSKDTAVREVMTDRVLCVLPEQTVEECMALMTDRHVRHLPVVREDEVIGVISIGDVVKEYISEQ